MRWSRVGELRDMTDLVLRHDLAFEDLYRRDGLIRLDAAFVRHVSEADIELHNRLMAARRAPAGLDRAAEAELLLDLAPHLEDFIGTLFGIGAEIRDLQARHDALAPLYSVKRLFVQRRAVKGVTPEAAAALDGAALARELEALMGEPLSEESYARHVARWMEAEAEHEAALDLAQRYAAWAVLSPAGREQHRAGVLFKVPHRLDMAHLVPVETVVEHGVAMLHLPKQHWRRREGFALTDAGTDLKGALDQVNYCIWCHDQGKDSCSKGLRDKKTGAFKKSVYGVTLAGCPLEEKISEMHEVKSRGDSIGALAIVVIDNPMAPATGHRICNDCMKACIFQKQEPVNIPQVETRMLTDVLGLPWGFEIYGLLTRWNPLDIRRPLPRPSSGKNVLVVGLGPAGYTLAHHLMNEGFAVVGIDGLKIEPLPEHVAGVGARGERRPVRPVRDISELYEELDERMMAGFGGVTEYGITVRWDKNFLKLVRLLLARRAEFSMYGGVRFGGTLTSRAPSSSASTTSRSAPAPAGPPSSPMKNGLARGIRKASDFLMALQLTGAAKTDSVANLQVRLPAVVIGGGLTAIDTATESLAYYPVQVEKSSAASRRWRPSAASRRCAKAGIPRRPPPPTSSSPTPAPCAPSARRRRASSGRRGSSSSSTAGAASPSPTAGASSTRRATASTTRRW